jgi:hypothetical protein
MSATLMLHAGGWSASVGDLVSVPVPAPTDSYVPVPYGRLVEEVKLQLPRFGLAVDREEYGLAREGRQMFGVLSCRNGRPNADYCLAIGLRSSYDRTLSIGLVAGSRVFCCDNLAFSGEISAARKHTVHVLRDLPDMVYRMLSQVSDQRGRISQEIGGMKNRFLTAVEADHLIVEAVRRRAITPSRLPQVLCGWERPRHAEFSPRTAWSLFNVVTEVLKGCSPRVQMDGSLRLSSLFQRELSLN